MHALAVLLALATTGEPMTTTLVDSGRHFRAECTVSDEDPAKGTRTLSLSLVAEDGKATPLWKRRLRSLWGAYTLADRARLGFEVDGLSLVTLKGGPRTLLAHTPDGWYLADPATGEDPTALLWEKLDSLPVTSGLFVSSRVQRIDVQSLPGHAFKIAVRNGPPLAAERSYRRIRLEARGANDTWSRVSEESVSDAHLAIVGSGAGLELFISARTASALKSGQPLRAVFLVYELDGNQQPVAPARAIVPLSSEDVAVLTTP
jgi:hypothetical protein